ATPAFAAADATLDVDHTGSGLRLRGDSGALEQLFLNLFLNAAQALPAGGHAHVATSTLNGCITATITDDGSGITADAIGRVLDPFFTTRPGGTGLGLPIARQIAVAHGGDLSITSEPGAGTTVSVRLPAAVG